MIFVLGHDLCIRRRSGFVLITRKNFDVAVFREDQVLHVGFPRPSSDPLLTTILLCTIRFAVAATLMMVWALSVAMAVVLLPAVVVVARVMCL